MAAAQAGKKNWVNGGIMREVFERRAVVGITALSFTWVVAGRFHTLFRHRGIRKGVCQSSA